MPIVNIKSATITEKGQIAIPKEMRKIKGFKTGNKIAIVSFDDHIEIRPFNHLEKKLSSYLLSEKSLAKDWNTKEEDKAWKDL